MPDYASTLRLGQAPRAGRASASSCLVAWYPAWTGGLPAARGVGVLREHFPLVPLRPSPARAPTRLDLTRLTLQRPGWCVPMTSMNVPRQRFLAHQLFAMFRARASSLSQPPPTDMMASTWQDVLNKTSGCVRDWHRACFQHSLANSPSVACAALAVSLWLGEPMPLPLPMRMAS